MRYLGTRRGRLVVMWAVLMCALGVAALAAWDMPIYLGLPVLAGIGLHCVWSDAPGHPLYRFALLSAAALAAAASLLFGMFFVGETVRFMGRGDPYGVLTVYLALVMGLIPAALCGLVFLCVLQVALAGEKRE